MAIDGFYGTHNTVFAVLMKNLDFGVIIKLSQHQNIAVIRDIPQTIITTVLVFIDKKEVSPSLLPSRATLTEFGYSELEHLTCSPKCHDQRFSCFILAELSYKDKFEMI